MIIYFQYMSVLICFFHLIKMFKFIYYYTRIYSIYNLLLYVPIIKDRIDNKIKNINEKIYTDLNAPIKDIENYNYLPKKGIDKSKIIELMLELRNIDKTTANHELISGTIYNDDINLQLLMNDIFYIYSKTNPLHPDIFPGLRKIERDLVKIGINLFNGNKDSRGCITSGGTESILLACKAYRDWGKEIRGIRNPNIIVFNTAHAAFDKASNYFNIKLIKVSKLNDISKLINKNTVAIVGSAPSFPHGLIDPIEEMGLLASKHNIGLHVDACLGGFILAFSNSNYKFDMSIKGVTSLSADFHKYGFAPKGTSLLLYKNKELLHHQYFVQEDWMGGIYATPTIMGSRSGNLLALTWATLLYYGYNGYQETSQKIMDTTKYIAKEISKIRGIYVFGEPNVCVVGIGSNSYDIYSIHSEMSKLGWNLNALQFPSSIHLCITLIHTKDTIKEKFINDLNVSINIVARSKINNDVNNSSSIYGTSQKIKPRCIVKSVAKSFLDCLYE